MIRLKHILAAAAAALALGGCSGVGTGGSSSGVVVLDIGHCVESPGAATPGRLADGSSLEECRFWYKYSYDVKREIEKAGYGCTVCNRGNGNTLSRNWRSTPAVPAWCTCASPAGARSATPHATTRTAWAAAW